MMTSSNGNIFRITGPLSSTGHRAFVFSLICAWTNGLANNGDVGDFKRHHAHYDVTVMFIFIIKSILLKIHWYEFLWLLLTLGRHWFTWGLGVAKQQVIYNLNKFTTLYGISRPHWINQTFSILIHSSTTHGFLEKLLIVIQFSDVFHYRNREHFHRILFGPLFDAHKKYILETYAIVWENSSMSSWFIYLISCLDLPFKIHP